MDNPLLLPCGNCTDVMLHALQLLTRNEAQIRNLFPHREVLRFRDNERNKSLLEIVLDASTLSCILDSQGRCYKVYLFLDEVEHANIYKYYCNSCCLPIADNFWIYGRYTVELKTLPIDTFFVFCQLSSNNATYGTAN